MQKLSIVAEKRGLVGRGVKSLRREGVLPANIYGKGIKSQAIKLNLADFEKIFEKAGETSIVDVQVGKTSSPALIHNVQMHPVTDTPLHVDFHKVNLKEKVRASVPVVAAGESPAVKQGLGTAILQIDELEVEALPTDLPDKFEIDMSGLDEVGKAIFVKDIKVDKAKIKIEADPDEVLVKVDPLREEEEEPAPVADLEAEEADVEEGVETEGAEKEEQPTEAAEKESDGSGSETKPQAKEEK